VIITAGLQDATGWYALVIERERLAAANPDSGCYDLTFSTVKSVATLWGGR
jgi:hypothetical protein